MSEQDKPNKPDRLEAEPPSGVSRRDFIGKAGVGVFVGASGLALAGLARAVLPEAVPDPSRKFKIGLPRDYPAGTVLDLKDESVVVFRDSEGFYAISTVCTHLACVVTHDEAKGFQCPCHGSEFSPDGAVTRGPAPTALPWLEVSLLPNGQLAVDAAKKVPMGTKTSVTA